MRKYRIQVIYQRQDTAQKMKFSIKDFVGKCDQTEDLVRFTEEILDGRFQFLCSERH